MSFWDKLYDLMFKDYVCLFLWLYLNSAVMILQFRNKSHSPQMLLFVLTTRGFSTIIFSGAIVI